MGPGHHPRTSSGLSGYINIIELYAPCNGSTLVGMNTGMMQKVGGAWTDTLNLAIRFCRFSSGGAGGFYVGFHTTNLVVENCVFDGGGVFFNWGNPFTRTGVVIRNNIFGTFALSGGASISEPRDNFVIDHNIFIGTAGNIRAIAGGVNCTISNNIFFGRTIDTTGGLNFGTGCAILNNITYLCTNSLPTPGNSGSGNINADPQFVNFPAVASVFSYLHNYRLKTTSPGYQAATDGTDLGVYGNNNTFSMTGEPDGYPVMRMLNIYNTTVPPGGVLDVRMKASVPVRD